MNAVTFAGVPDNLAGERLNKNFEFILPETECTLVCGDGEIKFREGEAAVVPPLTRYVFRGRAVFVTIEQALLPFREITVVKDDGQRGMAHAARQAEAYYSAAGKNRQGVLEALGALLCSYAAASSDACGLSPVVSTIKSEVEKHLSDSTFSLEDSLKKMPLNYDYVRKLFKKETGLTPHEYLLGSRMRLARQIMSGGLGNRYSEYSVAQIAEACGFAEPLYFSRVFKKYYGAAPSDYIRTLVRK